MTLVAVDIGGTNVRFAVAGASGLGGVRSMLCADYPSLAAAFATYAGETGVQADAASIAVAGPVRNRSAQITNLPWQLQEQTLALAAGIEQLELVNDFGFFIRARRGNIIDQSLHLGEEGTTNDDGPAVKEARKRKFGEVG